MAHVDQKSKSPNSQRGEEVLSAEARGAVPLINTVENQPPSSTAASPAKDASGEKLAESKAPIPIKDFIDDNQKLLAVTFAFGAFGLLWKQLLPKDETIIPYLCFLAVVILLIVFYREFKKLEDSVIGFLFQLLTNLILVNILIVLVFNFPDNFRALIVENLFWLVPVIVFFIFADREHKKELKRWSEYQTDLAEHKSLTDEKQKASVIKTLNRHYLDWLKRHNFVGALILLLIILSSPLIWLAVLWILFLTANVPPP